MSALHIELRYRVGAHEHHTTLDTDALRVAIIGPSGIGKTSLLRAVLGLEPSARGVVALHGERLDLHAVEARGLGWVPQDAALYPHLDVRRNLAFSARESVDRVAELVGVTPLLDRQVARLSGGERQRIAIGRALASRPRMLVLDEPLSALDRVARHDIAGVIERERAALEAFVLLASHDEMDVASLADEVYEMGALGALTRRP
jgi:molybdate transport system ATP-binding protein